MDNIYTIGYELLHNRKFWIHFNFIFYLWELNIDEFTNI